MPDEAPPDGYEIRLATPDDAPAILELFRAAFPTWPAVELTEPPLEHLRWKVEALGGEPARPTVVTHDGEVVAAHTRWVARALLRGAPVSVNFTTDIAVHPDHRGRGLTRRTDVHDREAGLGGEFGVDLFSNSDAVLHIYDDDDRLRRRMRAWRHPIGRVRSLAQALRPSSERGLAATARRFAGGQSAARLSVGVAIEEIDTFDEQADALWEAARGRFAFECIRDAAYLNWRHADRRSGARTILAARSGAGADHRLLAWLVLRPDRRSLRLADFLVHPDHEAVAALLFEHAARLAADDARVELVSWLPEDHPAEAWFAQAGFARDREPIVCQFWITTARKAAYSLIEPLDRPDAPIHVTMGDFDFV